MKKDTKAIGIVLFISIIVLIFIIIFFLIYIYWDYNIKEEIEFIDISKKQGQIEVFNIEEDDKQEVIEVAIEPIKQIQTEEKISIDKFYYNQLDSYSKLIYESIEEQKESIRTGTQKIDLPSSLGKILEVEEEQQNARGIFTNAMNAFEYDNPDMFYIDMSKLVLFYQKDVLGNYKIYLKCNDETQNYFIDGITTKQDVDNATAKVNLTVQQIKNIIQNKNFNSEYQKVLYVHDWIINNTKYDETLDMSNRSNIYGVFEEKQATCGGYAKTFKYLMDELNINSIIVQGKATDNNKTEHHAWNYVKLNEKWYGIDCTWDDPIIEGNVPETTQILQYTYFLKGQNVFNENHIPMKNLLGTNTILSYPELNIEDYVV
ncbi:MAG: transglutaminase domain-containing protein [Clostridia bacterium]|nr:transglutaminase domain-containing protein [Clostridia bacterium]